MARIHLLPDDLISQIAAGEVVERPASVVKELLENALDAGAGQIRVDLTGGGKRSIRVADDGLGMDRDDALLAFDRHATSKIGTFEELERVATLGFRGEALASIAAVARVELLTADEPGEGHRVRVEGGRIRRAEPAARDRGTTVEVASLFFNVPARRKFLKTARTELRRSVEVVQGYALARPDIAFTLSHEGRALLEAPAAGEGGAGMAERVRQIFGASLVDRLESFGVEDGVGRRVAGLVGDPSTARPRRLFVFVNGRLLRDRAILATYYRAVRDEWRNEEFPSLFLFLDLPPEEIDVNVHPQKAEVRFRSPAILNEVSEALRAGLARSLGEVAAPLSEPWRRPSAPAAWEAGDGGWRRPPEGGSFGGTSVAEGLPGGRLAEIHLHPGRPATVPLSGRDGQVRPFRILGQYKGTLVLLEGPDGLYLIDQHVAHERILYERFRRDLERERPASQRLLEPQLLELARDEALRLGELAGALEERGFSLTRLSGDSLGLTAVPAALGTDRARDLLLELARDDDEAAGSGVEGLDRRLLEALSASLACRSAVKMHDVLSIGEMEHLVSELFRAEQPYACPHGRPVVLTMEDAELERRFGRR